MQNKEIIKILKLYTKLLELHDENVFKIKALSNATFQLDKVKVPFATLNPAQLEQIQGVGKSIVAHIQELVASHTMQ